MDVGAIVVVLVVCVAVVAIAVTRHVRSGTRDVLTLRLTKTPSGVYTAMVDVGTSRGGFTAIPCVVDTGSRHLCVAGADVGGTRRPGPAQIHYGTQVDDVSWHDVAVRVGGTVGTAAVAVANRRHCKSPVCFNVFGLAIGGATASFPPTPGPFATQFMERPRFSLALGQRGGSLVFNPPATPHMRYFDTIPGDHAWYVIELRDILHVAEGHHTAESIHGHQCPRKLMVDSGSNMLGVPRGLARGLRSRLRGGGDLVLRLADRQGRDYDYVVPESTYRHTDGTLLLDDDGARHDVVVLGSLFMAGRTFVFEDGGVGIV